MTMRPVAKTIKVLEPNSYKAGQRVREIEDGGIWEILKVEKWLITVVERSTLCEEGEELPEARKEMKKEESMVAMNIDPYNDIFVVVSERDHEDWLKSEGSIIHETQIRSAKLWDAVDRVKMVEGRYGKAQIFKLVPMGTTEECESMYASREL